ncbi:thiolase family protein [Microbacterium sp. cf332]|uniref:thiolase family protein n=1 Tax=Microbacterium sp. cf332 TaxID=1761804 RepID=UPI000886ECF3|nr:thiolase family protein [Microbacterium sp. cf332]SDQ15630.1 acetyl-CoA acyltransferase [Microbacterium sp. cf332]
MAEISDVYFIDGMRTPFGRAGEKGMYWNTRADDLVVKAIRGVIERNPGVPLDRIDDVAIAATTQEGDQGLTLGRTAAILAGLPQSVPGFAIDRMCAGAMTSVTTMAGSIGIGMYDLALAGGVEHMGRHPLGGDADPNPRFLTEKLVSPDALNMGITAERLHDRFPALTKERADRFGMLSQHKAQAAYDAGKLQPDLVPVAVKSADGAWGLATEDEGRRPETTMAGLAQLKTPFRPHGRVTAGTSSPLTDGATISLLAGAQAVKELGLTPKMRMVSFGFAGVQPEVMGIGPIPSTEKALAKAGLSIDDIGLFELNEAFAVQVLSLLDHFGIADDDPRVNAWGGAIAVGHPLAASGVRLMIQLAAQFAERPDVRYGLTAMCVGLGQGGSVIWENPHYTGKKKNPKK